MEGKVEKRQLQMQNNGPPLLFRSNSTVKEDGAARLRVHSHDYILSPRLPPLSMLLSTLLLTLLLPAPYERGVCICACVCVYV